MTTVNPATSTNQFLQSLTAAQSTQKGSADTIQDRFLKLLVTQMRNQDPLNPLDNAQVTTQLAQISTVSGIDKLNSTVAGLSSSLLAAQSVQAGNLVGHGVLAPGNALLLQQGGAVGGVSLAGPADQVTVTIHGSAGQLVKTMALGPQQAGVHTFQWDGLTDAGVQSPNGAYTFEINAIQAGKQVSADALGFGQVSSVTLGGDQLQLNTLGLGPVALGQVKQIF
jgi:flagellar basal-body rod modification protein FlgD